MPDALPPRHVYMPETCPTPSPAFMGTAVAIPEPPLDMAQLAFVQLRNRCNLMTPLRFEDYVVVQRVDRYRGEGLYLIDAGAEFKRPPAPYEECSLYACQGIGKRGYLLSRNDYGYTRADTWELDPKQFNEVVRGKVVMRCLMDDPRVAVMFAQAPDV